METDRLDSKLVVIFLGDFFILLERQSRKERKDQREICPLLVHTPDGCKWPELGQFEPGSQDLLAWVSHAGAGAQGLGACLHCFPRQGAESWMEVLEL